jgi:protein-S-isoprenylcysteine O-methyltransferase Ste14
MALLLDLGERAFAVLLAIPFVLAFVRAASAHPSFVVLLASESLSVFFILIRRRGPMATASAPVILAFAGTGLSLLVRPGGIPLVAPLLSTALMTGGLSLCVLSKLYLNRSFGLIAANRGIKVHGPYRLVRHPMYLGYIVSQFGFLLASFSFLNLLIYGCAWTVQVLRIAQEEKVLREDPIYRDFTTRVSARLLPGVY